MVTQGEIAMAGIAAIITILWVLIGIGVARMVGKIGNKELVVFDIFFWPFVALVFAVSGGVR